MSKTALIASFATLAGVLLSVSCSGKLGDYCDKVIDCEGGNDKDRSACVEIAKAQEDIADDYDCSDSFDNYVDCLSNSAVCKNGKMDESACEAQSKAASACNKAASGKGNDDVKQTPVDGGKP